MINIASIKEFSTSLGALIAALEAQEAQEAQSISIRETLIVLREGEIYAGIILKEGSTPSHHLILLPGEKESINWIDAKAWAAEIGAELPTRREQSLLFANCKAQFKENRYWSGEQHASYSTYAWYQYFDNGGQNNSTKSFEGRARAVRRLPI